MVLAATISDLFEQGEAAPREAAREAFSLLRDELSAGRVRAAEPDVTAPGGWRVNPWVKQGILLGYRFGDIVDVGIGKGRWPFFDYDTLPLKRLDAASGVRMPPGGSTIRDGAHLGAGVVCMPPMYINIGAWVGGGTVVDSHALVGVCAQIGQRVRVGTAAQIGGVIEPADAMPVVVEDDVLVGGNCGLYEGVIIKSRAVVASGTIISGSTTIYDLPNRRAIVPEAGQPVVVPEGAIVVPGARSVTQGAGREWGISLAAPVIVEYRRDTPHVGAGLERWLQ